MAGVLGSSEHRTGTTGRKPEKMRRATSLLAVFALVLSACAESQRPRYVVPSYSVPPYDELVKMYDYDTSEPLGYEVLANEPEDGATLYDITYQSSSYTVPAWLVIPDGQGPFPVVLYAHGYTFDRDYFLNDALAFAQEGFAGLLIDYPHSRPPRSEFFNWQDPQNDVEGFVQYAIDLRRGIDLLQTLPEIDADRIGYVGFSIGGWVGSILVGVEDRIVAYVLSGIGAYSSDEPDRASWAGPLPVGDALARYQEGIAVVYPVVYVGHNRGAALLFQESKGDEMVSLGNIRALFEAASGPKTLRWYAGP
jgi:pimeloyl-ACP methyl ester carboxylesterase